jgi:hypothetical protein
MSKAQDDRWTRRTIRLIESGRCLILRGDDGWYLHSWTSIPAGPDAACWGPRDRALEVFNLKWAFALAPLYGCKVYSFDWKTGQEVEERR